MMWDGAIEPAPVSPPEVSAAPPSALEFVLEPDDLIALARHPGLVRHGPSAKVSLVWYDSPDGTLAQDGMCLTRDGRQWRLERLRPGPNCEWPAALPAPILDEAASPAEMRPTPPFDAAPVAAFQGRRRLGQLAGAEVRILHGTLRGITTEQKACRLTLAGPASSLSGLVQELSASLRLSAPRACLALEAVTVAKGGTLPPRHLGAPSLGADVRVTDGLARIIGHLLDAMLHWTDRCREAAEPEAVHQARVATRRLRSALSLYKRAAACPALTAIAPVLKHCGARLGAARDWDVFLQETGARLSAAGQGDPRVTVPLRTAHRRRNEAYAELRVYLAGPEFRALEIALACAATLRPWEWTGDPAVLTESTAPFAARVLDRRLKRVRRDGRHIAELPLPALHELRKDCKRLRYASEFFAPGFPKGGAKRFLKRLAELQDELGALNDAAGASGRVAQLGRAGRGYAAGLVEGWAAVAAGSQRARICKAWKTFRTADPFWR